MKIKRRVMNRFQPARVAAFALVWLTANAMASMAADPDVPLRGHIASQIQQATFLQRTAGDEMLHLGLAIQLDQASLDQALERLYAANGAAEKHFYTATEFAQEFGLEEKRKKLKEFALSKGFTLDASSDRPGSMIVKVSAPSRVVEQGFKIEMNDYRNAQGQRFHAQLEEPSIPTSLTPYLSAVLGLSNVPHILHPHFKRRSENTAVSPLTIQPHHFTGATGPLGGLAPIDIKTVYGLSTSTFTGVGQTAAVFELDGYRPSDIAAYQSHFGITGTTVTFIGVNGIPNLCGGIDCSAQNVNRDESMGEVALDIEMLSALAPGLSTILVYDSTNTNQGAFDAYDQIATDNLGKVVSTSWGAPEADFGAAYIKAEAQIFQRMALQGQSFFAAAGDNGAYDNGSSLSVDDPASQPYCTGVGGTSLSGSVTSFHESVWNNVTGAGGGGISRYWTIPTYQLGVSSLASKTFRNVPDVALNADPDVGYSYFVSGGWDVAGGTSASTPLWTAFAALINQQRISLGNGNWGFANSQIYQIAAGPNYSFSFNDVTTGDNGFFGAGIGYDNATGWGSFNGFNFITNSTSTVANITLSSDLGNTSGANPLANVYAFPNPWDIRRNSHREITFANVPDGATVKLFTLSGFLVRTLTPSASQAVWDLTNDDGRAAASGLYFYLISSGGNTATGKVAIIK